MPPLETFLQQQLLPWGSRIIIALIIFVVGRWLTHILCRLLIQLLGQLKLEPILVNFSQSIVRGLMLLLVIIATLNQLGINTTSLIALIGAAGLAIGLALQDALKNLASGVVLIITRPFAIGNYIEVANIGGTVKRMEIFNTILHTTDNRVVLIPNGKVLGSTITNYSELPQRRIDLTVNIRYDDDLQRAKDLLLKRLQNSPKLLQQPAPVVLVDTLGEQSMQLIIRAWTATSDYTTARSVLLENIKLDLDQAGLKLPRPQLDVHLAPVPTKHFDR
ncbi:MAG TPA: mechanosensitive ion channel [Gammaproteobacteria bacterium]|nr:mechanosensitive ion channel [Gammaproteobacteria bacterium]